MSRRSLFKRVESSLHFLHDNQLMAGDRKGSRFEPSSLPENDAHEVNRVAASLELGLDSKFPAAIQMLASQESPSNEFQDEYRK